MTRRKLPTLLQTRENSWISRSKRQSALEEDIDLGIEALTDDERRAKIKIHRTWLTIFTLFNLSFLVVVLKQWVFPQPKTFWLWEMGARSMLPFSTTFTGVAVIAAPYKKPFISICGFGIGQLINALCCSIGLLSLSFDPSILETNDISKNSYPMQYGFFAFFLAFLVLLRQFQKKVTFIREQCPIDKAKMVINQVIPIVFGTVLASAYFSAPLWQCLAMGYQRTFLKRLDDIPWQEDPSITGRESLLCEDIETSSTTVLFSIMMYAVLTTYYVPFERNNYTWDDIVKFKLHPVHQFAIIGLFIVLVTSLFSYSSMKEFDDFTSLHFYVNDPDITGYNFRFILKAIPRFIVGAMALFGEPLSNNTSVANMSTRAKYWQVKMGCGSRSTEFAKFYVVLFYVLTFILITPTFFFVYQSFSLKNGRHVPYVWYGIFQLCQPVLLLSLCVLILSRPKSKVSRVTKYIWLIPFANSLIMVCAAFKTGTKIHFGLQIGLMIVFPPIGWLAWKAKEHLGSYPDRDISEHLQFTLKQWTMGLPTIVFILFEGFGLYSGAKQLEFECSNLDYYKCEEGENMSYQEADFGGIANRVVLQAILYKFAFDAGCSFSWEHPTVPEIAQLARNGVKSIKTISFLLVNLVTMVVSFSLYGMTRDTPYEDAPSLQKWTLVYATFAQISMLFLWLVLFLQHFLSLLELRVGNITRARSGAASKEEINAPEMKVWQRLQCFSNLSKIVLKRLRVADEKRLKWSVLLKLLLSIIVGTVFIWYFVALFILSYGQEANGVWMVLIADDCFVPAALLSWVLSFEAAIDPKVKSRKKAIWWCALPAITYCIKLVIELQCGYGYLEVFGGRMPYWEGVLLIIVGLCVVGISFFLSVQHMKSVFSYEVLRDHCLDDVPMILTGVIPPVTYMMFKAGVCGIIDFDVKVAGGREITLSGSTLDCVAMQLTIKPIMMLICGMAGLRVACGPWQVLNTTLTMENITTMNLSVTQQLSGVFFFVSAAIAVVMFGIGGEHGQGPKEATVGFTIFVGSFAIFLCLQYAADRMVVYSISGHEKSRLVSKLESKNLERFGGKHEGGEDEEDAADVGRTTLTGRLAKMTSSVWDGGGKGVRGGKLFLEEEKKKEVEMKEERRGKGGKILEKLDFNPGFL